MKIRSAVPENGCLIVLVDGKKTTVKHIRIRLLPEGGCVNNKTVALQKENAVSFLGTFLHE